MIRTYRRLLLALAVTVALAALGLSGYLLTRRTPEVDPLADYRPALAPSFTLARAEVDLLQTYSITVRVDPVTYAFTGTLEMTFPVSSTEPLRDLYFRLYPNLPQFDGKLLLSSARVNDLSVSYAYTASNTAARLALSTPLQPGSRARARLGFRGQARQRSNDYYTIFGASQGMLSLDSFYPVLAQRRGNQWALDVADPQGDVGYRDAALYQVDLTTAPGQVVVATGSLTRQQAGIDGWITSHYVLGPAREFALLLSPRYQVEEAEAYGVRVRSYFLPEQATAGHSALYNAVAALQIYSDTFGPYPYREMAVAQAPLTVHGMEFPGLSLIGSGVYQEQMKDLETLVVHEVAHQWWYNQVGSDQNLNPWLDEGLAEFSTYYYYASHDGVPYAEGVKQSRWQTPLTYARQRGLDAPIGLPVSAYKGNYETIVYGKGALFFSALREQIGDALFSGTLKAYLARYMWRIATPAGFQTMAEETSGRSLEPLFREWVEDR